MLFETDTALAAMLKTNVIGNAPIAVSFDTPSRPWIQSLQSPCVNLFLFDLREAVSRRESTFVDIRDEDGIVVARRPPMQRWDLHYTVTVFGAPVITEHKLLGVVLRYFASVDAVPLAYLPEALAEPGYPVTVSTGGGMKRAMFLNYAGDMKAGFEMSLTVPIPPLPTTPTPPPAPPVQQEPQINVAPLPGPQPANVASPAETVPPRRVPPDDNAQNPTQADSKGSD